MHLAANLSSSRYEWALDVAGRLQNCPTCGVVFDIGAGEGIMKQPLEAGTHQWFGFDLEPRGKTTRLWNLMYSCPEQEVTPNLVLLLDVIEHLVNPGLALDNIAQVLPPNGELVITTPNPRWSRSRLSALLHGTLACFTQQDLDLNGHVFPVWPHIMEKMLRDSGFEIVEYVTLDGRTGWPRGPFSLRYPLRCLAAIAMMTIEKSDRSACGMSYGIVAKLRTKSREPGPTLR
jgi:SAM-dependent methyltransferase